MGIYVDITNRIIDKIQSEGTLVWRKPWRCIAPINTISNRRYQGINRLVLSTAGFNDPRFLTFKQALDLGGSVRKGERGLPIVFWRFEKDKDQPGLKPKVTSRLFTVFNIQQCSGLEVPEIATPTFNADAVDAITKLIDGFKEGPRIRWGGQKAFYSSREDLVGMPSRPAFESSESCFATLAHELSHSTGHASRLNRSSITEPVSFGSETYSQEELVAEIGAAFLCGEFGIDNTITQSAAYIKGWLKALKNDSTMLVKAACQAQKSADWILGRTLQPNECQEPVTDEDSAFTAELATC